MSDHDKKASAFNIYNQQKTKVSWESFSEKEQHAFLLVPALLDSAFAEILDEPEDSVAPIGIFGYKKSKETLELLQKYFPDWKQKHKSSIEQKIEFLSLMGSVGSIAYGDQSDFDYWCCVKEPCAPQEIAALERKIRAIEIWCEEKLSVEVHVFITSASKLKRHDFGEVNRESCGSALGKLLKEEYFRSSLHVAGKIPLWWAISSGTSVESYSSMAMEIMPVQREHIFIDVGPIESLPMEELLGASLWQLNKAISSPHKSILKMALLLESALGDHKNGMVAEELKDRVHAKPNLIEDLDAYVMMMERLFSFFSVPKREKWLPLLRKCFFLKTKADGLRWFKSPATPKKLKDKVMKGFIEQWEWDKKTLESVQYFDALSPVEQFQFKDELEYFLD